MSDRLRPRQAGFRMPPEWAVHECTWMMWPCRPEVWDDLAATRCNYADVAHAIRRYEHVRMVVRPQDKVIAHNMLGSDIDLFEHPIDDSWSRDAGPCYLMNDQGDLAGASFAFNAWGEKYLPYNGDNSVSDAILTETGARIFTSSLIAEGGGISVDGEGTVLSTNSCFPNANRNPDWTLEEIEAELLEMLGGQKVIWLPGNVEETETDGHVDGIAVFAAPGKVVMQDTGPKDHPWHDIHASNIDAMEGQTDAVGRLLEVHTLPDASAAQPDDGPEICDSYVNFYICNGAVIVPKYGIKEDSEVVELLAGIFVDHDICQVSIPHIAGGGGGIHCITQQQPRIQ